MTKVTNKKFRITKITNESVYLRWDGYGNSVKGLSIRVPVNDFVDSYKRTDQNFCVKNED